MLLSVAGFLLLAQGSKTYAPVRVSVLLLLLLLLLKYRWAPSRKMGKAPPMFGE